MKSALNQMVVNTSIWDRETVLGGIAPNQVNCQVRVRGASSNLYGVNVTKAVIGAYM